MPARFSQVHIDDAHSTPRHRSTKKRNELKMKSASIQSSWDQADEVIYQAYLLQGNAPHAPPFLPAVSPNGLGKKPGLVPVWREDLAKEPSEFQRLPFWGSTCTKPTISASLKQSPRKMRAMHQTQGLPYLPALSSTGIQWRNPGPGKSCFDCIAQQSVTAGGFRQAAIKPYATFQSGTSKSRGNDRDDARLPALSADIAHAPETDVAETALSRWTSDPLVLKLRKVVREAFQPFNDVEELENLCVDAATIVVNEAISPNCCDRGKLLGMELLSAMRVRHRHHGGHEMRRGCGSPTFVAGEADGLLAYLPKYVKRPIFIELLKEEAETQRSKLDRVKLTRRTTYKQDDDLWKQISAMPVHIPLTRIGSISSGSCDSSSASSRSQSIVGGGADSKAVESNQLHRDLPTPLLMTPKLSAQMLETSPRNSSNTPSKTMDAHTGLADQRTSVQKKREAIRKRRSVFKRLQDDAQLHKEELVTALKATGVVHPHGDWVEECFNSLTKYTTISEEQFLTFARKYEERQRDAMLEAFQGFDRDSSGSIDQQELGELLGKFGIEPMEHILEEVIKEVDENDSGVLEFEEFEEVVHRLSVREGFTRSEFEMFLNFFARMDRDESNSMSKTELRKALNWFNFLMPQEAVNEITEEASIDGSGELDFIEFMVCMRKVRERELANLHAAAEQNDADRSGSIDRSEFQTLIRGLGYMTDPVVVKEVLDETVGESVQEMSFSQLWRCLQVYRNREGFSEQYLEEIDAAFDRCNTTGGMDIGVEDIGRAIRFMGYPLRLDTQQMLSAQVDVDMSGKLDRSELRKMVRMIRYSDFELMKQSFEEEAWDRDGRTIPIKVAHHILKRLHCVEPDGQVAPIPDWALTPGPEGASLDVHNFCRVAMQCRDRARHAFRDNGGFSHEDLKDLMRSFQEFDQDGSGDISKEELMIALSQLLPTYANDIKKRGVLVQLVKEADLNGDGGLDFQDFVRLMRQVRDLEAQAKIAIEITAVQDTGFRVQEVQGFRELFLMQATKRKLDGCEWLSFEDVRGMMAAVCPMGARNSQELEHVYREVRDGTSKSGLMGLGIEFPEFLRLMRKLIDSNFGEIRDRFYDGKHPADATGDP